MLKKTLDEAAFFDRQVLTARRFIDTASSQEEAPMCPPSPADSLHKELANVSQESSQEGSLSPDTTSAPAQQPRTGGAASSRLDPVQDFNESGPDSAHSQPARDRLQAHGTDVLDNSPERREPDSLISVSPLTDTAASQTRLRQASPQASPKPQPARRRQPVARNAAATTTTTTTTTTRTSSKSRRVAKG